MQTLQTNRLLKWLTGGMVLLALIAVNVSIYQKEQVLKQGKIVILQLAPVDPRSLMQGDYMALSYALIEQLEQRASQQRADKPEILIPGKGVVVVGLDDQQRAITVDFENGQPLAPQQLLMQYHSWGNSLRIGTPSYFFQEGNAKQFEQARYGEFRVGSNGEALLTYLLDQHLQPIGP